jgi:hypothetical protein
VNRPKTTFILIFDSYLSILGSKPITMPRKLSGLHSERSSSFSLSKGSTSSKSKHRVRIEPQDSVLNKCDRLSKESGEQSDDESSVSSSTRSSGSPPPIMNIRRNRTLSGSKSEDHMLTMPSGQVSYLFLSALVQI